MAVLAVCYCSVGKLQVCVNILLIKLQDVGGILILDHVLAIVAEEHVVGRDVRADLQLHQRILGIVGIAYLGRVFLQRGTVTANKDRALDADRLGFCSRHTDGHLLGVGAEIVQGLCRCLSRRYRVEEVLGSLDGSQDGVVGIGIRAVAAAIDVAEDVGVDTHGIASRHLA